MLVTLLTSLGTMEDTTQFRRVQTQFIAAAIDPVHGEGMQASSGTGAGDWGIWRVDPGPRGVQLRDYERKLGGGVAPRGWKFDKQDWWLEEHGLIMEKPDFPLPPGKYLVTGGREVETVLTVHPDQRWELADGAKLYDVTHLPCRAARYKPANGGSGAGSGAGSTGGQRCRGVLDMVADACAHPLEGLRMAVKLAHADVLLGACRQAL